MQKSWLIIILIVLLAGTPLALHLLRAPEAVPVEPQHKPEAQPVAKPVTPPQPAKPQELPGHTDPKIVEPSGSVAGPLDRNAALDLWAQKIVQEEGSGTDESVALQQRRQRFQAKPVDDTVLARLTNYLTDWRAALDPKLASHLQIVSVDCRFTTCEILAVENGIRMSDEGTVRTPIPPVDLLTLQETPWWKQEKFSLAFTEMQMFRDHQMLSVYLMYPAHPPPPDRASENSSQ